MAEEGTARATLSALFFLHFHYATDHTVKKVVQYVRPQYFFLYFSYISGNMPGIYSIVYPTLPLFFSLGSLYLYTQSSSVQVSYSQAATMN